jgi:hypothetical protein
MIGHAAVLAESTYSDRAVFPGAGVLTWSAMEVVQSRRARLAKFTAVWM